MILVVDDEERIREIVQFALEREGFVVHTSPNLSEARKVLAAHQVEALVLDVGLPDGDGLSLCREIRTRSNTPILFLSARSDEIDRVLGLELGGDDYVTKPFSPRELVARLRAILRRTSAASADKEEEQVLLYGPVRVDRLRRSVTCGESTVQLTATEFGLLETLLQRPGVVFSRVQLMQRAYSFDHLVTERTIDTHVKRLRAKFREFDVDIIATVNGVGYKLKER